MDELLDDLRRLNDKVKSVEKRMDVATKDDPLVQKLLEIKGVGLVRLSSCVQRLAHSAVFVVASNLLAIVQ